MALRTPQRRVPGVCDYDGCTATLDVEIQDSTFQDGERTAMRLCEKHGDVFVRAGLKALGVDLAVKA
jgi:threonine dehydratase